MKKSNIALAVLAGAVIGGAVALAIRSRSEDDEEAGEEVTEESPAFESIARQFSDRIAAELHAAEQKIKSAVKKGSDLIIPEGEYGVFL